MGTEPLGKKTTFPSFCSRAQSACRGEGGGAAPSLSLVTAPPSGRVVDAAGSGGAPPVLPCKVRSL